MSKTTLPRFDDAHTQLVVLQKMPTGGSDLKLKKNVTTLPGGIEKITALRPVIWNWKNEAAGKDLEYGFIAQEVEKVLPDLITKDTWIDGTECKFLAPYKMIPYLVAAIQDQQAQIEELQLMLKKTSSPHAAEVN